MRPAQPAPPPAGARPGSTAERRCVEPGARRAVVALVISNLEFGGAQRQVVELANGMDPRRFEVHVVSLSPYAPLAAGLECPRRLHVIEKRWRFDAGVVPRLARLLRGIGADIVQGWLFDAEIAARLAGRLAGTPVVAGSERNTSYRLKWVQRAAYRLTRGMMDLCIANSRAGAQFNARALGHPPGLYRVVHNGVDPARFAPAPAGPIRAELGIAPGERVVGMFASFKEQKNHPLFLRAARRVLAHSPRTRLLFAGDELFGGAHGSSAYKARVERLVDELGLRGRCVFLGNRADVERLYPACDLTALPSLFEGTPNVALESMACGVPVVATDVSDNAHVIPDGRAGRIVPPGDEAALAAAIGGLLANDVLRARLGAGARAWVLAELTAERLAEKTGAVFEEFLKPKSAQG